jgi:hypothetical protein
MHCNGESARVVVDPKRSRRAGIGQTELEEKAAESRDLLLQKSGRHHERKFTGSSRTACGFIGIRMGSLGPDAAG